MKTYINQDVGVGILLIAFVGFFFMLSRNLISEAAIFPYILIGLLLLFAVSIIVNGRKRTTFTEHGDDEEKITFSLLRTPLITFGGIVLYCLCITFIGFFTSTVLFVIAYLYLNQYRSFKKVALTVVLLVLFVYLLFSYQLNVKLPTGFFI